MPALAFWVMCNQNVFALFLVHNPQRPSELASLLGQPGIK